MRLGIPDRFIGQGTRDELFRDCGFDKDGIFEAVKKILGRS
jgi:1-deoxy-D-xylulose-5-phosphate synthase